MNFVLEMIGKVGRDGERQSGRRLLESRVAVLVGENRIADAVRVCEGLGEEGIFGCGHLYYLMGDMGRGRAAFSRGLEKMLEGSLVEGMIGRGERAFKGGEFEKAIGFFERGRRMVEVMMAAAGGVMVCGEKEGMCAGVLNLSHLLLRGLARVHLGRELAAGLRGRGLEAFGPWATGERAVGDLLELEMGELMVGMRSGNPEMAYRLGLVAGAIGEGPVARGALRKVLAGHPHHVGAAVRVGERKLVERAFSLSREELAGYFGLARAAGDAEGFERAVGRMTEHGAVVKAHLAFELGQMNLLDERTTAWREMSCVG